MAAGMGSRYGGLKQLDGIGPNGETIMDYSLFDAVRAGFSKVVFIIRRDIAKAFEEQIIRKLEGTLEVAYVFQETDDIPEPYKGTVQRNKPWGTGHALISAAAEVTEPFLIINADDYYGPSAFASAARRLEGIDNQRLQAALIAYRLKHTLSANGTVARGICRSEGGYLTSITETLGLQRAASGIVVDGKGEEIPEETMVSMNMWLFSPPIFSFAKALFSQFLVQHRNEEKAEFFIPDIVEALIAKQGAKIPLVETEERWYGVTYAEDKNAVMQAIAAAIQTGTYPETLWRQR
jgi:UTP-glucose-1-phosphate uridylyltransferase